MAHYDEQREVELYKPNLMQGDCLERMKEIESGSVDLIVCDLPYGTMNTDGGRKLGIDGWDVVINTNSVMKESNRILRKNGKMCLFAQDPFSTELKEKALHNLPYNYSAIWEKDSFANALSAKKAMVNYYEDILIFSKTEDQERKHPLINYADKILDFIPLNKKDALIALGMGSVRFFRTKQNEFARPTRKAYDKLIFLFGIDRMDGFMFYEHVCDIDADFKKKFNSVFNLAENEKSKSNILKYKKDRNGHHPTQKPVLLLEDLIKTFSNENDLVVDMTMGSGSAGVACKNTNRRFIGIELDENYFNIAKNRIENS